MVEGVGSAEVLSGCRAVVSVGGVVSVLAFLSRSFDLIKAIDAVKAVIKNVNIIVIMIIFLFVKLTTPLELIYLWLLYLDA